MPAWLRDSNAVNLSKLGIPDNDVEAFDLCAWQKAPNVAFGGRTPNMVIDDGTDKERLQLALMIDAIAALQDGAFS